MPNSLPQETSGSIRAAFLDHPPAAVGPNPDPFPFSVHFPIGALSVLTALLADASVVIFAIYRKSLHPAG